MGYFFDERSAGYDAHMQQSVVSFEAFYAAIARPILRTDKVLHILDIGCGTGLELDPIFRRAPNTRITGVDLSANMLTQLCAKYAQRLDQMTLIQGSYLQVPFGTARYDFALSVMTLHHLLPARKAQLYARIRRALKAGGRYIEGDYVVSPEEEARRLAAYREKMGSVGAREEGIYHVDVPLTMARQRQLLLEAGFVQVDVIWQEGEAAVYVAEA